MMKLPTGAMAGVQQLCGLLERLVVRRLGRRVELPGAGELAVDAFLGHQLLDHVDRLGVGVVEPRSGLEAELVHGLPDADRHARGGHAAVSPRRARPTE
jgi:hypothetical protein